MLWSIMDNVHGSIDSCQNKVSADPYHLTVLWAQVSNPSRSSTFLKLSADELLVFKWSQAQVYFLKIHMIYVVFVSLRSRTIKILIWN